MQAPRKPSAQRITDRLGSAAGQPVNSVPGKPGRLVSESEQMCSLSCYECRVPTVYSRPTCGPAGRDGLEEARRLMDRCL